MVESRDCIWLELRIRTECLQGYSWREAVCRGSTSTAYNQEYILCHCREVVEPDSEVVIEAVGQRQFREVAPHSLDAQPLLSR